MKSALLVALCVASALASHPKPPFVGRIHRNGKRHVSLEDIPKFRFHRHKLPQRGQKVALLAPSFTVRDFPKINGDNITLGLENIPVQSTDQIGIYCPATSPSTDYLDMINVADFCEVSEFSGSCSIPIFDMRCEYQFRYFHEADSKLTFVAMTDPQAFEPQINQVRIMLTGDTTEMRVMFTSNSSETPRVKYGLNPHELTQEASGTVTTYSADQMCNAPANVTGQQTFRHPGYFADVVLTGLTTNTVYYYVPIVGGITGDVFSFKSSKAVAPDQGLKFLMWADQGVHGFPVHWSMQGAASTTKVIEKWSPDYSDLNLIVGDIAYSTSAGYIWEQWHQMVQPYVSTTPTMVQLGNHEYDHEGNDEKDQTLHKMMNGYHPWFGNYYTDSLGECGLPAMSRFHMPGDWLMASGERVPWYSFDQGNVHFLMISSEHDWSPNSVQYNFIENDLKNVNREITPWLIVGSHRPLYESESLGKGMAEQLMVGMFMREWLEPLFTEYKVNLVMSGHYHAYERSCAALHSQCVPDGVSGTVTVVVGTGGCGLNSNGFTGAIYSAIGTNEHYGFSAIETNATHLHFQFIATDTEEVWDEVTLPLWK